MAREPRPVQSLNPFEWILREGVREGGARVNPNEAPSGNATIGEWYDVRRWHWAEALYVAQTPPIGSPAGSLGLWLQGTMDNYEIDPDPEQWRGADIPYEVTQLTRNDLGTDANSGVSKRNFGADVGTNPTTYYPGRWRATYAEFPYSYVRLREGMGGGGSYAAGEGFDIRVILRGK